MPSRFYLRQFYPNTYHHIYNRGAYKQKIFLDKKDRLIFLDILKYYLKFPNGKPLTKIGKKQLPNLKPVLPSPYQLLAYCLMPNHFHLLLFQAEEKPTLTDLLKRVSITYSMYFQARYQHSGTLFQGKYKSVPVRSDNQLLYLSKYIHLNPQTTEGSVPSVLSVLSDFSLSSFEIYINPASNYPWVHPEIIQQSYFQNSPHPYQSYQQFVLDKADTNHEIISHITIE